MPFLDRLIDVRDSLLPNRSKSNTFSARRETVKIIKKTRGTKQIIRGRKVVTSVKERLSSRNFGKRITEMVGSKQLKSDIDTQLTKKSDISIEL